ncbi:hypothetical protein IE81DRAFT_201558 [Ceraceosorus guamensis]|uniref:Uncharacterized protein n=1 Tax=Ceraceosorus guamensis TaxID=1522189 RepID=A0A316VVA3_9BASI|nr:hypothetical protein IE81DRAFT_201558 [Ceraceosorus guamensis]PWN40858.1 hypothetical protein IE81DRAFT_201558 [Ceraceosorus guamensis]
MSGLSAELTRRRTRNDEAPSLCSSTSSLLMSQDTSSEVQHRSYYLSWRWWRVKDPLCGAGPTVAIAACVLAHDAELGSCRSHPDLRETHAQRE